MTTLIAFTAIALGQEHIQSPKAVLPMTQVGYGVGYTDKLDIIALVRPMGVPIVRKFPGEHSNFWYAEQRVHVLDSPDNPGAILTAYYAIHGLPDSSLPYGTFAPAKTLDFDDGTYLLVGIKQPASSINFDFAYAMANRQPAIPVTPNGNTNVVVSGLFAVDGVTWAENGPRWRFVMETIAASMANARGDALVDMTFLIRRIADVAVPAEPGDGGYGKRGDAQKARIVAIVRDVIARTEQSATTMERIYHLSVLVEYDYGATEFAEAVHKLVGQGMDVPDSFIWPILEEHQVVNHYPFVGFPNDLDRTKMIEIAESTIAKQAASWAFREIPTLADTSDQRRYFALIARRDHPGGRAYAYEKLIDWLDLPITLDKVDDGHGRTVRIVNEEAVRQAIATRLGIQPSMKVRAEYGM